MLETRAKASRRRFVLGSTALLGTTLLAGCDRLIKMPWFRRVLDKDEDANLYVQRLLLSDQKLAPEYAETDISPHFKPNGTEDPKDKPYKAMAKDGFKTFTLEIGGLVEKPLKFGLTDLRAMPSRTQITRHDCVEGWSCIGKWTGVPLADLLKQVGLKPQARFIVFYCADSMDDGGGLDDDSGGGLSGLESVDDQDSDTKTADASGNTKATMTPAAASTKQPDVGATGKGKSGDTKKAASADTASTSADKAGVGSHYYESIDLADAYHPQTILAYEMNGQTLPVAHGAPLRLRLERQLGYKMAKYIMRIDVVDSLDKIGSGGGGYWEDQGYEWYAGI